LEIRFDANAEGARLDCLAIEGELRDTVAHHPSTRRGELGETLAGQHVEEPQDSGNAEGSYAGHGHEARPEMAGKGHSTPFDRDECEVAITVTRNVQFRPGLLAERERRSPRHAGAARERSTIPRVRGDRVEVVVDSGGSVRTYEIEATKAGRRVEVTTSRGGMIEVSEVTRSGTAVRTGRFLAARVIALVEHPAEVVPGGGRRRKASRGQSSLL